MSKITGKIAELAVAAVGFTVPFIKEYIGVKIERSELKNEISVLSEDNRKLRKENESLKQQLMLAAVIAAASFAAFIAILIVLAIK